MQRETTTLETPLKKSLVLKSFLNAGERNKLRAVYLGAMKIDGAAGAVNTDEIPGTIIEVAEKKLLELAVVSYDGKTEYVDVLEALENATPEEWDFVTTEAGKVNGGNLKAAK